MAAPTLTIAICSYQRREALVRLLTTLDQQARNDQMVGWDGVDVVAVIDGSTDGSVEAARAVVAELPIHVVPQAHAGLSAARNRCLEHVTGELIYFLDDDLIPAKGTVRGHREASRHPSTPILLGPCIVPAGHPVPEGVRRWYRDRYALLAKTERIARFDHFSIANASGPTRVFREAGGFDTGFVGYGLEDHELGLRLMKQGVFERYEPDLVAWHHTEVGQNATARRGRESGRNLIHLLESHPEATSLLFHDHYPSPVHWALDRLHSHSPKLLFGLAQSGQWGATGSERISPRLSSALWILAFVGGEAAGVAERSPSAVPHFLGRPEAPTVGHLWRRRHTAGGGALNSARPDAEHR